jgi:predicted MFS family arabinose efflux permease
MSKKKLSIRQRLPHQSVILIASAVAFSLLGDQALYAVLPVHFKALGLFPYQVGILLSANRWIRLVTNHAAERISARVSTRYVMLIVLVASCMIAISYGRGYSFPVFLGARLLWGFCWSFLRQIGIMTSVSNVAAGNVGKAVGYYTGISKLGSAAGCFVGALLYDILGYTSTFLILGLATLPGAPMGYASQRELQRRGSVSKQEIQNGSGKHIYILAFFGFVVGCVGPGLIMSTLGFVLKNEFGNSIPTGTMVVGVATINGILLSSRHIIDTLGGPFFGAFVDWVGHRKGALICFTASTLTLAGAMIAKDLWFLLSMVLLFFILGATATVLLSAKAAVSGSRTYASFATAIDLGAAFGPIVGWTIFEFISKPGISFAVGAILYAVAALISSAQFIWPNRTDPGYSPHTDPG